MILVTQHSLFPWLLPLGLLAACEAEVPSVPAQAVPIPPAMCTKISEGLEKLRSEGAVTLDGKGQATVEQQAWLAMGDGGRDQFVKMLGYDAACASGGAGKEQMVVVRGETGVVLREQAVQTQVDPAELLGADQP